MIANIYLNFNGNTEDAFEFYKSVFGGEFTMIKRFSDTPNAEQMPAADRNKIMHIALPLGKNNTLMATDSLESMGHKLKTGNNLTISLHGDSEAEAKKIFDALSAGGNIGAPFTKMFWGEHWGMLTDQFGIQWMVSAKI